MERKNSEHRAATVKNLVTTNAVPRYFREYFHSRDSLHGLSSRLTLTQSTLHLPSCCHFDDSISQSLHRQSLGKIKSIPWNNFWQLSNRYFPLTQRYFYHFGRNTIATNIPSKSFLRNIKSRKKLRWYWKTWPIHERFQSIARSEWLMGSQHTHPWPDLVNPLFLFVFFFFFDLIQTWLISPSKQNHRCMG